MPRTPLLAALLALAAPTPPVWAADPPFPPPKSLGPVETYGGNLRRSMGRLAASTPEKRNTVRVLFYGQSITEQAWTKAVADDLRKRFPDADLLIENRAIGGHAAQLLVKTAEADLYPFYPDLLVFHVYGSHVEYENILRRVRERTTADVLQMTDHLAANDAPDEETDPARLTPKQWNPWMNAAFLPSVSKKYGTELADVRGLWKRYLADHGLKPPALLKDGVHLNAHGDYLMAEIAKAYLRPPAAASVAADPRVKTLAVGTDVDWKDGTLAVEFTGNRVDLVGTPGGKPAAVRIDGKKPSELPGVYAATRATAFPGSNWPVLLRVGADAPWVAETWTLTVTEASPDGKACRFKVAGSVTGDDGEGVSTERFASKSGRVVLEPADWNVEYAVKVFKKPLPTPFAVTWKTVLLGADEFTAPAKGPGVEPAATVAQGLPPGRHRLELTGGPATGVVAVRVYDPAGR